MNFCVENHTQEAPSQCFYLMCMYIFKLLFVEIVWGILYVRTWNEWLLFILDWKVKWITRTEKSWYRFTEEVRMKLIWWLTSMKYGSNGISKGFGNKNSHLPSFAHCQRILLSSSFCCFLYLEQVFCATCKVQATGYKVLGWW